MTCEIENEIDRGAMLVKIVDSILRLTCTVVFLNKNLENEITAVRMRRSVVRI